MASASADEADVNLIPMLDLVMQLIMFFMITMRLVQYERADERIILPETQMAFPKEDEEEGIKYRIFVNLSKNGQLLGLSDRSDVFIPSTEDPSYTTVITAVQRDMNTMLKTRKESFDRESRVSGHKEGTWQVGVVIRAHRECRYNQVWAVLDLCQKAGFEFWQLSVMQISPEGT